MGIMPSVEEVIAKILLKLLSIDFDIESGFHRGFNLFFGC
jgi:hypothetical protein